MPAPRYRRNPQLIRRDAGSELMLFDPRDDSLHVLNPAGAVLWEALVQPCGIDQLVQVLTEAFEVAPEDDVRGDVTRALGELEAHRLVVREPGPA